MFAHLIGWEEIGGLGRFLRSQDPLEGDYEVRTRPVLGSYSPFRHLDPMCRTKEVTLIYAFRPSCSLRSSRVQSWSEVLAHGTYQGFPPKSLGVPPAQGVLRELDCSWTQACRCGCWLLLCWLTDRCNVCLCDYADGETLRTLPCLHSYHRDCIDHWLKVRHTYWTNMGAKKSAAWWCGMYFPNKCIIWSPCTPFIQASSVSVSKETGRWIRWCWCGCSLPRRITQYAQSAEPTWPTAKPYTPSTVDIQQRLYGQFNLFKKLLFDVKLFEIFKDFFSPWFPPLYFVIILTSPWFLATNTPSEPKSFICSGFCC